MTLLLKQKYIILESEIIKTYDETYTYSDDGESISNEISLIIQIFKNKINKMINEGYELNGSIVNITFKQHNGEGSVHEYVKLIQSMKLIE
jgi:hypothetical protein